MRKLILIVGLVLLLQLLWSAQAQAAPPEAGGFWHTVRYGETLFSIGRRYGVNPYAICRANELHNCNYIWRGQRLWIPYSGEPHPPSYCSVYHRVRPGQTLYGIARLYGIPVRALAQANHIHNWNYIYAGQRLCIPYLW
jgi:spore germination protein